MDFNGICMSPVDFSTVRVEVGDVLQGSKISQQVAQRQLSYLTCFIYAYLRTMKSEWAWEKQLLKKKNTLLNKG